MLPYTGMQRTTLLGMVAPMLDRPRRTRVTFCSSITAPTWFDSLLISVTGITDVWDRRPLTLSIGQVLTARIQTRNTLRTWCMMPNTHLNLGSRPVFRHRLVDFARRMYITGGVPSRAAVGDSASCNHQALCSVRVCIKGLDAPL